jgi:hypothetical protein
VPNGRPRRLTRWNEAYEAEARSLLMRFSVTTATGERLVYDDENGGFDESTRIRFTIRHGLWETVVHPGVGFQNDIEDVRCVAWMFAARADPDRPVPKIVSDLAAEWIDSLDLGWSPDDHDPDVVY